MATIQASIQLYDGMSNVLHNIYSSVNTVIDVFQEMHRETGQAFDVNRLQEARNSLNQVEAAARQIDERIQEASRAQENFNDRLRDGQNEASGLRDRIKKFAGAYLGIQGIKMGVQFVTDAISLQNVQNEAETKLQGIMQQRMGASPDMIQQIKDLASAQQQLGVIGDEVQLMGAQQLATFLNTSSALETLLPAMNNLAVQQNGAAVSAEAMTNIGNMVGKVMQGQVGALTRVGVTFSEAQEKVLKYGNEQERAATLAQVITDNVSNMNAIMAATPQGQIQQIANTWGDIKEVVGARLYPAVLTLFQAFNSNMPRAETAVMGIASALSVVINVLGWVANAIGAVAGFFQDNWSIIEPVIWGIVAALTAYGAYLAITNGLDLISKGIKMASIIAQYAYAAATGVAVSNIRAETAAQMGLNTALLACPLTWIIIAIIAIVAAVYAVVAAINHFTGSTISATGIICGAFSFAGAVVQNVLMGVLKIGLGIIEFLINGWVDFSNFFANVFNDPIGSVIHLFADLGDRILGIIEKIAEAIDFVFGSNLAESVSGWRDGLADMANAAADRWGNGTYEQKFDKFDTDKVMADMGITLERLDYGSAFQTGYQFGEGAEDKITGIFDNLKGIGNFDSTSGIQGAWEGIEGNTGSTAGNTAAMADSMDLLDEDLKYLRDAAEQEIINRFTLAELKVDVNNNNTLTTQTDFDDVNRQLANVTGEILNVAAEGGHF